MPELDLGKVIGPVGPVGPEGATGGIGPQGPAGQSATVAVGTTTTGEPGSQAIVTNGGTESAAVLNFVVPQGPVGPDGKSAYAAAVGAGYTGTEQAFAQALSKVPGHMADAENPHQVTAEQVGAVPLAARGAANGVASLDDTGKVPSEQLPPIQTDGIPMAQKGAAGGVATLDDAGKVPVAQIPVLEYDAKGAAQAVQAGLDAFAACRDNPHEVTAAQTGAVPATRKVNNKALSADISLTPADVGARPSTWLPTAAEVGADAAGAAAAVDAKLTTHGNDATKHITAAERTNWNGKVSKSTKVSATISTTWTGSAAPYTQALSVSGVTATSVVEVLLPTTATAEQVEAYQALNLQDGGQAAGSITLKAFGDKNTIAIPVTVIVRGDL